MTAKNQLTIGLLFDDSLDRTDGVQQYVLTLGRWLSSEGHSVHYLVGETARTDIPNLHSLARNWHVRFNGNRMSIPLPARKRVLRQLLHETQFDIIHVQTPYSPLLSGRLLRRLSPHVGLVGSFHILPYNAVVRWANKLLALLNRRTATRIDLMLANSDPSKIFADEAYHFDCAVVPNPFPLRDFVVEPPAPTVPTVVFLGRLVARKGALQLLQAVAYMREQALYTGPLRVVIGGKGELLPRLEAFVRAHHLTDVVTFSGFVSEEDKAAFLADADVAAFPSISGESFGISLLEALAASRGVVLGGDNPGYRSVLAPLSETQLVRPTDVAGFAAALARWLTDDTARATAAAAQKLYVRQFDINVVGPQIVKTYRQALRLRHNVR